MLGCESRIEAIPHTFNPLYGMNLRIGPTSPKSLAKNGMRLSRHSV